MAMGLRINTNTTAVTALRNLRLNDRNLATSLERLSTGLRINRAADDPSGLVISEQLRAQIEALNQATRNTQDASNLLAVADSALQEVADLIIEIQQSILFAMNTGAASPDQILAEQDAVDNALAAIDRIAATTRYADRPLLNGQGDFVLLSTAPATLDNLNIRSVSFAPGELSRTFTITVTQEPQRAAIRIAGVSGVTGGTTLRIHGGRGTQDVVLASGANDLDVAQAINTVAGFTGVWASGVAGVNVTMFSEDWGSRHLIRIESVAGNLSSAGISTLSTGGVFTPAPVGINLTPQEIVTDRGLDAIAATNGLTFGSQGRHFSIVEPTVQLEFDLDPDLLTASGTATFSASFVVGNTGLQFQVNEFPFPSDRLQFGIDSVQTSLLGFEPYRDRLDESVAGVSTAAVSTAYILKGGFLSTLKTGAGNDLFQNPGNALSVSRAALNDVSSLRGFLGALGAQNVQPAIRQLGVAIENLGASLSTIRDLDFAEEVSNFTKRQILFQSGIAVLANANSVPQAVLSLITG
jgi:flagellin